MKKYERPSVKVMDHQAEGVFAGSGCYSVTYTIQQNPQQGRVDYRIQFNAVHNATHHSTAQTMVLQFNQPVTYVSSNGTLTSGDGTSTLYISYNYHNNNGPENIGLGDVCVYSEAGLTVTHAALLCNEKCDQHDHL